MAKQSGIAWTTFSVDDAGGVVRDIRNDMTDFQFATPRGTQDITGIDKSAREMQLLLADFSVTVNGVPNMGVIPSATSHGVFGSVPSTSVARTTTITIGGRTLAPEVLYTDYQLKRDADGKFTYSVPGVLADGTVPTWA